MIEIDSRVLGKTLGGLEGSLEERLLWRMW